MMLWSSQEGKLDLVLEGKSNRRTMQMNAASRLS